MVFRDALAGKILERQLELSLGDSLFGCNAKPFYGFSVILRYSLTIGKHDTEIELSPGKSLIGSKLVPLKGFFKILRNA